MRKVGCMLFLTMKQQKWDEYRHTRLFFSPFFSSSFFLFTLYKHVCLCLRGSTLRTRNREKNVNDNRVILHSISSQGFFYRLEIIQLYLQNDEKLFCWSLIVYKRSVEYTHKTIHLKCVTVINNLQHFCVKFCFFFIEKI